MNKADGTALNYCKDCSRYGTWVRDESGDVKSINGLHTFEYCYRCSHCGATTFYPKEQKVTTLETVNKSGVTNEQINASIQERNARLAERL
jgi:ribosome-binding protein aMBF1 (putative translation factor)